MKFGAFSHNPEYLTTNMTLRKILTITLAVAMLAVGMSFTPATSGRIQDSVGRAGMLAALLEPNDHHNIPVVVLAGGANFPHAKPNARSAAERGEKVFYDEVSILPQVVSAEGAVAQIMVHGKLPRPLGYAAFVGTSEGMVVAGGCNAEGHLSEVYRIEMYDTELRTEALPDLPRTVAYPAFALLGNKFYVIGGQERPDSTTCLISCYVLDLNNVHAGWKELAPMPGGRMLAAAAVMDGVIYVMGGCSLQPGEDGQGVRTYLRDVLCYDPSSNTWARVASEMPESLVGMANPLPTRNGKIFVIGGDPGVYYRASLAGQAPDKHPGQSKAVYSFTPSTGAWVKEGELRQGVATLPAVQVDGVIYTISGETHPGVRTPAIDAFKID